MFELTLRLRRTPAVSMATIVLPSLSMRTSTESRVVPATSLTITRSDRRRSLCGRRVSRPAGGGGFFRLTLLLDLRQGILVYAIPMNNLVGDLVGAPKIIGRSKCGHIAFGFG